MSRMFLFKSEDEKEAILKAMDTYGGSFVKQLATLYRLGDHINKSLITQTWPAYFWEYRKMAHPENKAKKRWCQNHPRSTWAEGYSKCAEGFSKNEPCIEGD